MKLARERFGLKETMRVEDHEFWAWKCGAQSWVARPEPATLISGRSAGLSPVGVANTGFLCVAICS